jgi:hypothetical protein
MGFPLAGQGKQFHKAMRYKEHIDGNTPNLSLGISFFSLWMEWRKKKKDVVINRRKSILIRKT